ncbi:hypothetical protein B7C42_01930 [Nocardia cerradoensis]|uniref:S1 motif domain-containing protein n=1 Tax=Nocardia cerradoensis TaxID=85688 RepID=A0A231H9V2_9NOCA|nr:hypothetical protein [Nocardia cerradoensis]OXR45638.1 hypothetical protein B7C42_01930 [Nocardia cerradoensis]
MIEPDLQLEQELEAARSRYPIGDHVTGVVTLVPRPGVVGLFVDLGHPPTGFVDLLSLPFASDQWPTVGTVTKFEVLQHTCGQVRLRSVLPWSGPPPVVGTIARFTVDRHLDVTRRILLRSI